MKIIPILNYLKSLLFLYKLNICKLFLVHTTKGNYNNELTTDLIIKKNLHDNLISLRNFIQEQVYNPYEKHIYSEKLETALKMINKC